MRKKKKNIKGYHGYCKPRYFLMQLLDQGPFLSCMPWGHCLVLVKEKA